VQQIKGIILAGGKGSRLYPITKVMNKNLLPVGNKFMLEYPIQKMREAGITKICITCGAENMGDIIEVMRSGKHLGVDITYRVQEEAGGISQAIALAEDFVNGDPVVTILGDNLFDASLMPLVKPVYDGLEKDNAAVFIKQVADPERFGIVSYFKYGTPKEIIEKPKDPPSNHAVIGVYLFPSDVFDRIRTLKPSDRGELEVTDLNNMYLAEHKLRLEMINGFWVDAGTFESYHEACVWGQEQIKK